LQRISSSLSNIKRIITKNMSIKIVVNGIPVESDNPSQLAEFVNSLGNKVEAPKKLGRPLGGTNKERKSITHVEWSEEEVFYMLNNLKASVRTLSSDPMLKEHTFHAIQGMRTKLITGKAISERVEKIILKYENKDHFEAREM